MKKDKFYYAYMKMLIEQRQLLMEAENWWNNEDHMFHQANLMGHDGSSVDEIHKHLMDSHGQNYYATSMMQWFSRGGSNPSNQYVRKLVHVAYDKPSNVHSPEIEGVSVHDNVIHPIATKWFHSVLYPQTQLKLINHPDQVTVYRGVGLSHDTDEYKPHSLESWTTNLPTALRFASDKQSRVDNSIPHIFQTTVNKRDILMCHAARLPMMPTEDELEGKEEYTLLGHTLKNIERIK